MARKRKKAGTLRVWRNGGAYADPGRCTDLATLARDHLEKKAKAGRTSASHLADLEHRLGVAVAWFGAGADPRSIVPDAVRTWAEALAEGGRRKPGTVRHYLNALSGLFRRAQEGLYVEPGYNPVAMMQEKPTGRWKGEAAFLLTGGRRSEVLGLDVADVNLPRGLVHFRPNAHRGLKPQTSVRTVPLHPQLREILEGWLRREGAPESQGTRDRSGLLFPARHGGMVRDLRKSLDAIAALCGMEPGSLRTRSFRHTYCSARLQTVQRIVRPGCDPARDPDPYEWIEVSRFQVQKEMGHGGAQLVDRIYGHAHRAPYRSEVVEYRVERVGGEEDAVSVLTLAVNNDMRYGST